MQVFENAAHGFRKSGLYPLTIEGIDKTKLTPSQTVEKNLDMGKIVNDGQEDVEGIIKTDRVINGHVRQDGKENETSERSACSQQPENQHVKSVLTK